MNVLFRYLLISEYFNKSNQEEGKKTTSLINVQQKFVVFLFLEEIKRERCTVHGGKEKEKRYTETPAGRFRPPFAPVTGNARTH